jgi:hypothetical protein
LDFAPQLKRDPLGSSMTELRVNALKSLPVLQYLLADAGLEPPFVPFEAGWKVYQTFLQVPSDSFQDVATFQTSWLRENPTEPVLEVLLGRQLTDQDAPGGPLIRLVALQFLFEKAPSALTEVELWGSDAPTLDRFLDQIEHSPQFQYACGGELLQGDAILAKEDLPDAAA